MRVEPAERASVQECVEAFRSGGDPDLSRLLEALWRVLYARIPALTGSRAKEDQHRILEECLAELGLPRSPDLQYVAGPVLWHAREKGVIPPAQAGGGAWVLDGRKYEAARSTLAEGITAYGDWMRDALRTILSEQQ